MGIPLVEGGVAGGALAPGVQLQHTRHLSSHKLYLRREKVTIKEEKATSPSVAFDMLNEFIYETLAAQWLGSY